jgi:TRAP-type C4-dicarboxylate transport system permease small subunit
MAFSKDLSRQTLRRALMEFLDRISQSLNKLLVYIAGGFMVGMVLLTCADIFLRGVWVPITGSVELVGLFSSVVAAFSLGYTQLRRGHISVDLVVSFFPERVRRVLDSVNSLVCVIFFAWAAWRMSEWSMILRQTGELTETLRIIYYPFSYGVALGCAVLSFVLLVDFLKSLKRKKEAEK